jgi:iron complex transport system substrate-binding protein
MPGIINSRKWMLLLCVILVVGALSACGHKENTSNNSNEAASSEETASAWPRTYEDALGNQVVMEKRPERIAAVDWRITERLMALDIPPVASDTVAIMAEWASMKQYFQQYQVESIGDSQDQINMEKLLETGPDLILASDVNNQIYEGLAKISDTISFNGAELFEDWQGSLREVAKVVGAEENAEQFIADMDQLIQQNRELLGEQLAGKTVAFMRAWNKDLYIYNRQQLSMYYDQDGGLGLGIPEGYPEETGVVSLEALSELNPDYIFVSGVETLEELRGTIADGAVWDSLEAVRNSHLYLLDLSAMTGGPLAVKYGVETVVDTLAVAE